MVKKLRPNGKASFKGEVPEAPAMRKMNGNISTMSVGAAGEGGYTSDDVSAAYSNIAGTNNNAEENPARITSLTMEQRRPSNQSG